MRKIRYRYVMLIILLIIPASFAWAAGEDVDNDGNVNFVDIQRCINCINGTGSCAGADVNQDNIYDKSDLRLVINYINVQSGGTPKLYSFPVIGSQIEFGSVTVGESKTQHLTLTNDGTGWLQIDLKGTGMSGIQAGDFSVASSSFPIVLAADGDKTIEIGCSPSQIGERTATLLLSTNDPNRKNIEYPLHCTGKRAEAACSLNAPFDFENDRVLAKPGLGFDSDRVRLTPTKCLNGTYGEYGYGTGVLSIEQITDYEYFLKRFTKNETVGGGFKVSFKGFGLNADAEKVKKFLSESTSTSLSQSFIYKYEVTVPNLVFDVDDLKANPLTPLAEGLLGDACKFRSACGDEFVYQVERGATLFISLTFKFASETDSQTFSKQYGANFGVSLNTPITTCDKCTGKTETNLLDISANAKWSKFIERVSKEIRQNSTLTVKAVQFGGDATGLPTIGSEMSCSLDESNPCRALIANLANYAATERFAQGVKQNPAIIKYLTRPYEAVGVSAGLNDEVTDAILDARERLADEYQKQSTAIDQANYKLTEYARRLTPTEKTALNDFIGVLERNRKDLRAAGSVCFSNLPACVAKADDTLKNFRPYDAAMLTLPKPYLITNPQTVQVKKNAEKFCDLPPGYVLTGIGGRIIDDTVKDIRLEGRYLNANGTFGSRKNFRCGDKEDMGSFLSVPNANPNGLDYVIVGFEAHSTGETLTITKILYRPFNPLKGRFYGGVESKQASGKGQLGFRLNQFTKDEDHAIIMGVGLRSDQEKIQGIQVKFGQLQIQ